MKQIINRSLIVLALLVVNTLYAQHQSREGIENIFKGLEDLFVVVAVVAVVAVLVIPLIIFYFVNQKNKKTVRENNELQILPNSKLILVFGILSILTCCCYGIIGLILGIIAIILATKATKLYTENPEGYTGFQNLKTGKIIASMGVILCSIYLLYIIYIYSTFVYDVIM